MQHSRGMVLTQFNCIRYMVILIKFSAIDPIFLPHGKKVGSIIQYDKTISSYTAMHAVCSDRNYNSGASRMLRDQEQLLEECSYLINIEVEPRVLSRPLEVEDINLSMATHT